MSGFSLASLYRGATSIQHPPAPLHHTPALDPTQGTNYAVFDPTNQTITLLQNQCYQPPFQMVGQYQPPPYQYQPVHMVPSPMQQMGTQQFQPLIPPLTQPRPTHPQLSPQGQPSYSWEEIDDALQGDITLVKTIWTSSGRMRRMPPPTPRCLSKRPTNGGNDNHS